MRRVLVAAFLGAALTVGPAVAADPPAALPLFEDDAEGLLKVLTNPTGDPGEGHAEKADVYSGTSSIKIVPMQRFSPKIDGWRHRIVEKPQPGEYRFLRFAWKAVGCDGIMIQFHDEKDWRLRYTSGIDAHNWGTKFLTPKPPPEWTVVTVDLFADFGEHTLQGIALTAFNGTAAYFDHIYLARTIDDLDRIDATGLRANGKPLELTAAKLNQCWADLGGVKAPAAYRAFWTLVAGADTAVPFLKAKLPAAAGAVPVKQIRQWILELDHEKFAVRETAARELAKNLDAAAVLLEKELERNPGPEARKRIERLLANRADDPNRVRTEKAIRVLEFAATPAAKAALDELAKGPDGGRVVEAARAAIKRMK